MAATIASSRQDASIVTPTHRRLSSISSSLSPIAARHTTKTDHVHFSTTPSTPTTPPPHHTPTTSPSSDLSPGHRTPPPSYTETAHHTPSKRPDLPCRAAQSSLNTPQIISSPSSIPSFSAQAAEGIQWKFASQGLSLLTLSAQESASLSRSAPLSRQLYVHALTYLLRGLPEGLSEGEVACLRGSQVGVVGFGGEVEEVGEVETEKEVEEVRDQRIVGCAQEQGGEHGVLHRLVAALAFRVVLLMAILVPFAGTLLGWACAFEREHHVSDRAVASSMNAAHAVRVGLVTAGSAISGVGEDKVDQILDRTLRSWVQSVASGLNDGVEEGMSVLTHGRGRGG